ncbi:uncharacterized protein [Typha latifolia]|uniref:uncharacterized protein n=1 Tax=Typha latifolia TaxID=4733 RepID=UPI003C2FD4A8
MIRLLFTVVSAEAGVVVAVLFKTPLRKLAIAGIDRLKHGHGPVVVKTIAGTMLSGLASSLYSMAKIRKRSTKLGSITPIDQVLMSRYILEASLMGYSLFLALIVNQLHHFHRELNWLKKSMEAVMKHTTAVEEVNRGNLEEMKANEEITVVNMQVMHVKLELQTKTEEAKTVEAKAQNLRKQSEGLLHEYERLLEDKEKLLNQLQTFDFQMPQADYKKIGETKNASSSEISSS